MHTRGIHVGGSVHCFALSHDFCRKAPKLNSEEAIDNIDSDDEEENEEAGRNDHLVSSTFKLYNQALSGPNNIFVLLILFRWRRSVQEHRAN